MSQKVQRQKAFHSSKELLFSILFWNDLKYVFVVAFRGII